LGTLVTGGDIECAGSASLPPRHDLFFEVIERVDHFVVVQVANMEHAHEVVGADLFHLVMNLLATPSGLPAIRYPVPSRPSQSNFENLSAPGSLRGSS
jgi:hypothetical protein